MRFATSNTLPAKFCQCSHVLGEKRNAQMRVNLPLTASPSALIARSYMTLNVTVAASRMTAGSGPPYRTDELRKWCLMEWRLPPVKESLWAAVF
jgi:hypothetical protein